MRRWWAVVAGLVLLGGAVAGAAERYEYDRAGRLIKVTYDDGSSIAYTYDANGNVVAIVTTGPPGGSPPAQPKP